MFKDGRCMLRRWRGQDEHNLSNSLRWTDTCWRKNRRTDFEFAQCKKKQIINKKQKNCNHHLWNFYLLIIMSTSYHVVLSYGFKKQTNIKTLKWVAKYTWRAVNKPRRPLQVKRMCEKHFVMCTWERQRAQTSKDRKPISGGQCW